MSRKILVVDEKPFMLRLIQHHLERAGYELIKARNQQEAMAAIEHQTPELVVMDDCPDAQFFKSADHPKSNHAAHSIPTIRMTDVPQDFDSISQSGADVILTKPFSPTQLIAEVKRLVPETNPI